MSSTPLKFEFDYFLAHQRELAAKYPGRFVVIKNGTVLGDYATEIEAFVQASKKEAPGTFLIQKCEPDKESITQTFRSRAMFA